MTFCRILLAVEELDRYMSIIYYIYIYIIFFFFYVKMGWKVHRMMSYLLLLNFWRKGYKHCTTGRRNVLTARRTILKNKPLVTFHKSILVSLWTFQPTHVILSNFFLAFCLLFFLSTIFPEVLPTKLLVTRMTKSDSFNEERVFWKQNNFFSEFFPKM